MNAFVSINHGFGGAEKQFDQLFKDMSQAGQLDESWGYERHDLQQMTRLQSLRRLWRLRGGRVVLNMSVLGIGVWPLLLLRLMGHRVLLYPHVVVSPALSRPRLWRVRRWLQRVSVGLATRVVAISDGNRETMQAFTPAGKIETIYNYVACENDAPVQLKPGLRDVAIIGRLQDQHKQQLSFIRRHGSFLKEHDITLHLFGSGPDEAQIREEVQRQSLQAHVVFHGWLQEQEIFSHPFRFVLNLSRWEGLPLSILESIYHDRIVLLSNIPGNRELTTADYVFSGDDELREVLLRHVILQAPDLDTLNAQKQRLYARCRRAQALTRLGEVLTSL